MKSPEDETVVSVFDRVSAQRRSREAIIWRGSHISYAHLRERVDQLAKGLLELGVGRGDKVALLMSNSSEWIYGKFAVLKTGAVLVPLSTRFETHELEQVLARSDATTLIMVDQYLGADFVAMINQICPELASSVPGKLNSAKLPYLRNVIVIGRRGYAGAFAFYDVARMGDSAEASSRLAATQVAIRPDDMANIVFTAGTTGFPKGAMLSHRNLVYDCFYGVKRLGLHADDRVFCPLPFFHIFGCWIEVMFTISHGGCVVIPDHFEPGESLRIIEEQRCTVIYGVPSTYIALLSDPTLGRYDTKSLRTGLMGASAVPTPLMIDVIERMGVHGICQSYSLTEAGLASCTLSGDLPEVRARSIGMPLECLEHKIVDPTSGLELPVGRAGELCHRGPTVGAGYYKQPEETAQVIDEDGWLHTGDLAVKDAHGYYRIIGRANDLYVVGGENVAPTEVENFLFRHPKIRQVHVVGVPDEQLGEVGVAFVELKAKQQATEDEIIDFCRDHIASYKVPRYVRFVSAFPTTASGSVQRFKLRAAARLSSRAPSS